MFTGKLYIGLKGHSHWIKDIYPLQNGGFITGSTDNTAKIWDSETGENKVTLKKHLSSIKAVCELKNNSIVTSSEDMTIIIWNIDKALHFKVNSEIYCVRPLLDNLVYGDEDGNIVVCNNIGEEIFMLKGHTRRISCLLQNDILISGSHDRTIKLWDNGQCIRTLEGHTHFVNSICQMQDVLASGSHDTLIKLWDIRTGKCIKDIQSYLTHLYSPKEDKYIKIKDIKDYNHVSSLCCLDNGKLLSNSNETIRMWDIRNEKYELEIFDQGNEMCKLIDNKVAVGKWDGSIKILK